MSNRNFNKQVTQSRKPLAAGGPAGTGKGAPPFKGPRSGRPTKKPNTIEKKILDPRTREQLKKRFSTNKTKVAVNKTQKGGSKRTKSMMDPTRAKSLGLK